MLLKSVECNIIEKQSKAWNDFVSNSPLGDILQFWEWGEAKKADGWQPLRIELKKSEQVVMQVQFLTKKIPFLGLYVYAPHGPLARSTAELEKYLPILVDFLKQKSRELGFAFVEIEPRIGKLVDSEKTPKEAFLDSNLTALTDPKWLEIYQQNGFKRTGRNGQPINKIYYDLKLSEEELLAQCKKTTRYNVRLASKKGVKVQSVSFQDPQVWPFLKKFYTLLQETYERTGGYPIRSYEYFEQLVKNFQSSDNFVINEVSFEGQTIAMNITARTKFWSSSFYAGSNRLYSKVKAPYLLRWFSVMQSQDWGSLVYDFWGVVINSGDHKGYSDHKLSFGGFRVDNYGVLEIAFNKPKHKLWVFAIKFRVELLKILRKLKSK